LIGHAAVAHDGFAVEFNRAAAQRDVDVAGGRDRKSVV
jgi:hypothetical protein